MILVSGCRSQDSDAGRKEGAHHRTPLPGGGRGARLNPDFKKTKKNMCERIGDLLRRNMKQFRGGLVSKARRLLYRSTLGTRMMNDKKRRFGEETILACWPCWLATGEGSCECGVACRERATSLLTTYWSIIKMIWWTGLAPWALNSLFVVALYLPS